MTGALARIDRRAAQLRRRRQVAIAGASCVSTVIVGFGAWVLISSQSPGRVIIEAPAVSSSLPTAGPSATTGSTTATPSITAAAAIETSAQQPTPSPAVSSDPAPPTADPQPPAANPTVPRSPATTQPSTATTAPRASTSVAAPPPLPPPTSVAAPNERVFASAGGEILVRWTATSLTLVSATPAAGWTVVESHPGATEIEVTFGRGSQREELHVHLENGQPTVESE